MRRKTVRKVNEFSPSKTARFFKNRPRTNERRLIMHDPNTKIKVPYSSKVDMFATILRQWTELTTETLRTTDKTELSEFFSVLSVVLSVSVVSLCRAQLDVGSPWDRHMVPALPAWE
jgi:hypothetical protein